VGPRAVLETVVFKEFVQVVIRNVYACVKVGLGYEVLGGKYQLIRTCRRSRSTGKYKIKMNFRKIL
jgi:hypothetical protein